MRQRLHMVGLAEEKRRGRPAPVAGHALPDEVSRDGHCHETYEPCKGEGQARVQFTAAGEEDEDGDGKVGTARGE